MPKPEPIYCLFCKTCGISADAFTYPPTCVKCGSTDVEVDEEYGPFCSSCHRKCNVIIVDEGIGPYEFWGDSGVHHDYRAVSSCCEADAWEDRAYTIPAEYEPEDHYDPPDPEPWEDPHEVWEV